MEELRKENLNTSEQDKVSTWKSNWYVLYVQTGKEDSIAERCKNIIDNNILKRVFVPKYQTMIQIRSVWETRESILFPGYVFLETEDIRSVFFMLKKLPFFNVLLGKEDEMFQPISKREKARLKQFLNDEDVIATSVGYKVGEKIEIVKGPLVGHVGEIKKINRHKRLAWVEMEMCGRVVAIELGLEVLNGKEAE